MIKPRLIKAAFDLKILLRKLSRLGVSSQFTLWLESYLTERELRVNIDGFVSRPFLNKSGVPQGSNLGPLLFILFFNERELRVNIEGFVSRPFSNKSGVPQGSNFGPLLFILFFNDTAFVLKKGFKLLYARYLKIYIEVRNEE